MKNLIFFITFLLLISSCTKDNIIDPLPIISISDINHIDVTSASFTATITSDGGSLVTDRGICWNEGTIPTISDNKTNIGDGAGTFSGTITGLNPNTKYYIRTYATNQSGTNYGSYISFTTLDGAIDADGNVYHAVTIGSQTWLTENLKSTKYNDNTKITLINDGSNWQRTTEGAYSWFNYDGTTYIATYGPLYNWFAVNSGKLCPVGWHVPSNDEWNTLNVYLQNHDYNFNGYVDTDNFDSTNNYVAKSLASLSGWNSSTNMGATGNTDFQSYRNKTGFNAFPAGLRYEDGSCLGIGGRTFWWSSSELWTKYAWRRGIDALNNSLLKDFELKNTGLSVRCVKN